MPTYELVCGDCDHVWDVFRAMKDRNDLENCSKCDSENVERYFGGVVRTSVFEKRFFEHLSAEGVFIESKSHLRRECEVRGFDTEKVPALN